MYTEKYCRLCALKFPTTALRSIDELKQTKELNPPILQYLKLKITDHDKLPHTACLYCCKTLSDLDRFRSNVTNAQRKLESLFDYPDNNYEQVDVKPSIHDLPSFNEDLPGNQSCGASDYANDLDTIDHFLHDFASDDIQDCDDNVSEVANGCLDRKPENLDLLCQNILKIDPDVPKIETNNENKPLIDGHTLVKKLRFKCYKCNIWLQTEFCLQDHFDSQHDVKMKYSCPKCNALFSDLNEFKNHLYGHYLQKLSKKLRFPCDICNKKFQSESVRNAHQDSHLDQNAFPCNECGRKFRLQQQLTEHTFIHRKTLVDDNMEVKCEQCDKICRNHATYQRHLLSHIPTEVKQKFDCEICDRKFVSSINLQNHLILHKTEKEREHVCDECGKVFKNKQNLLEHKITHSDERPFKCDECSKTFKTDRILQRHKLVHTDEKRFGCEVCGKRFRERSGLNTHIKIHSEERPDECNYCSKRFKRKRDLEVHLRQHTGERPFACLECNHYFSNNSNFIKHLKGKHKLKNVSIANKRSYPFNN